MAKLASAKGLAYLEVVDGPLGVVELGMLSVDLLGCRHRLGPVQCLGCHANLLLLLGEC